MTSNRHERVYISLFLEAGLVLQFALTKGRAKELTPSSETRSPHALHHLPSAPGAIPPEMKLKDAKTRKGQL